MNNFEYIKHTKIFPLLCKEITSKTKVKIKKSFSSSELSVCREKESRPENEERPRIKTLPIFLIFPTAEFLDFLNKFCEKKEEEGQSLKENYFGYYWETDYGTILAVYKLYKQDPHKFEEIVRKAENLDELKVAFAFRD